MITTQSTTPSSPTTSAPNSAFLVRPVTPTVTLSGEMPKQEAKVEQVKGEPVATDATKEVPVDIYEAHRGHPYIADILEVTSEYGKTGLEKEMKSINDYILEKISSQQLKPTKDTYRSIFQSIEAEMGLDVNLRSDIKTSRIAKYIAILSEESKLAQERKRIISGK